jgi:hypothetical protein
VTQRSAEDAMTNHRESADFSDAIDELRRLAREPYERQDELVQLRKRISTERGRAHRSILEHLAREAQVDLKPIFEQAQRRNLAKRHYVDQTLKRLQAQASERAKAQKKKFHRIRADYVRDFAPLEQTTPQLKFHQPIASSASAQKGDCHEEIGYQCTPPNFGKHTAAADTGPDPAGIWAFAFIDNDSGDCLETLPGTTLHDFTYQTGPPANSFAVDSIRVDLIANGAGTSHFGDTPFLSSPNPEYVHSFVDMDLYIAQQVNGEWQQWPLLSDRLFEGSGEYVRQIRLVLSGQTYPVGIALRKPDVGGGDILCHLQLSCSADTIGTDGRSQLDFSGEHGFFIGGVALLGNFV